MTTTAKNLVNIYGVTVTLSLLAIFMVVILKGASSVIPILVLALIEITFSFDNAVLNSQVLAHLSRFWQKIFLTVGIAIAVFGVRLIMPLLLVSITADRALADVYGLALNNSSEYSELLHKAYPLIAAFGGTFLLVIGLRFFGEKREVYWLNDVEAPLGEFNQPWSIVGLGSLIIVLSTYFVLAPGQKDIAVSAALGAFAFIVIKVLGELLVSKNSIKQVKSGKILHGKAAFMQFVYLEVLDASFSFDGVVAAFAITKEILLIAVGLGIGALYVRSITIHLLKDRTLFRYRYLVHGAHYAIACLGTLMLLSLRFHIPEGVTGFIGMVFIAAAIKNSITYSRKLPQ